MDDVTCFGGEQNLHECEYSNDNNCSHNEDAGVTCAGEIEEGGYNGPTGPTGSDEGTIT